MTPAARAAAMAVKSRAAERAAEAVRQSAADENRRRYPEFAAFLDSYRRVFGKCKVTGFHDPEAV